MGTRTFPTKQEMARSQQTPLASALDSFLRARWDLKPRTKLGYEKSIKRFMRTHDTVGELTSENVNDYLAGIANHKTMARNDCIALRQFSKWATKSGIFALNPLVSVELPKGHGTKRQPFTDVEAKAIIAEAAKSGNGARDQAIIVLGLATALRPKELWLLQLSDVDLRDGWLSVRLETTKTDAGERVVPLDPQVAALLDEYINDFRGTKPGPLFLNARGDPFAYWGFMSIHYRLRNRLRTKGVDGFQAYRSRHTGITNWVRQGVESPIVQQLAGHKSISTTQLYIGRMQKSDIRNRVPLAFTATYGRAV